MAIAWLKTRVLDVLRAVSSTGRRKRQAERKTHIFSPIAFSSTSTVKRALKLKTRVLDALGLQKSPYSDDLGRHLGSLVIAFSLCLSRKRLFQGSLGMLAMAFSPCQSRKRHFRGSTKRPNTVPLPTILDASFVSSRLPFPPACRGKGYFRAPPRGLRAALFGRF